MTNLRDNTKLGRGTMTRNRELHEAELNAVSGAGGPWGDAHVVAGSVVTVQGAPGGPGDAGGGPDGSMVGSAFHIHFKN